MQRVGIYVDAASVTFSGGFGLRYDTLRKFACRENGSFASRLNVYLAYDKTRAKEDQNYQAKTSRFCEVLRDFEFKVIEKSIEQITDPDTGAVTVKSSVNLDMAVDILVQAPGLDRIVILTNDNGFTKVVTAIQDMGCRVELVGFDNVPAQLKHEVDMYISGYTIPGMMPVKSPYEWGTVGSRVRGVCYDFSHNDGYGFLRYLSRMDDKLWVTDSRSKSSPYNTVFAHVSQFEQDFDTTFLPSRDLIFEFDLVENDKGLIAEEIILVSAP
ncbi:MAG: NYN domain-containing protein [Balneolales bacterium]